MSVFDKIIEVGLVRWFDRRRQFSNRAHDQDLLNQLLSVLRRSSVEWLRTHDFMCPWPARFFDDVRDFELDWGKVEHEFNDRRLEQHRRRLFTTVEEFTTVAVGRVFADDRDFKHIGISSSEMASNPKLEELAFGRAAELAERARPIANAHDELVACARKRGFSVAAAWASPRE